MSDIVSTFMAKSTVKAADLEHRREGEFQHQQIQCYRSVGQGAIFECAPGRERAKNVKWRAIEMLDVYLEEFEANLIKRGGKVDLG